jgi:hypothetical protein
LSDGVPSPSGPASFLWPTQSGDQGRFFAFFASTNTASSNVDVAMRVMGDKLQSLTQPPAAASAFLMPVDPSGVFPPGSPAAANDQSQPVVAGSASLTWVAFTDTDNGSPDIHLRSLDSSFAPQQATPLGINGDAGSGEPGIQQNPSMATSGSVLFLAWQDESDGQIRGRTYTPGSGLGTQNQISSGAQNKNVRVAATGSSGWVAVWESGTDVKLRAIGSSGTPSGPDRTVNDASLHHGTQDHPGVAVLGDGSICVVWADHGASGGADIFVQRYDKDLNKVPNDQAVRLNDAVSAGDQVSPVVAGSAAAGGSFVVAWVDNGAGHVRARLLDSAGGFFYNNVDGQNGEFQASISSSHTRANPTVAVGGAAPAIAIGWEDRTSGNPGIFVRRFPVPTK